MIPLSALTNIDDEHQAMAQRCCLPQVSSTSSQGPNFIHGCASDGNYAELNSVDGRFEVQHRGSHSNEQPKVIFVQYPKLQKPSIVGESSVDSIHPQGPLPPSPSDCDASFNEEPSSYPMDLTSRIARASEADDTLVASSLGKDNRGYQNHENQR